MNDQWLGKGVHLQCGSLGVFQGVIDAVHLDEQTITIKNVIHDGMPSKMSSVTLEAREIRSIEFVEATSSEADKRKKATSTVSLPKKKTTRPVAENLAKSSRSPAGGQHRQTPRQHQKNDCFDVDVANIHGKEFDFEQNLALFDKRRVLEEIESNQPDVVRLADHNLRPGRSEAEPKYRNDQNVLPAEPAPRRPITTEEAGGGEYVTDAGIVVPAVSRRLRERLMAAAEARGISREKLAELVARAATELAVQLVGGSRRFNPANAHQLPRCVVLCGPGQAGAFGMAAARHLAAQGAVTTAYMPELALYPPHAAAEMALYKLGCRSAGPARLVSRVADLGAGSVDLVVVALEDHDMWQQERAQPWHREAVRWCQSIPAPVLALDPIASPHASPVRAKASLLPGLPLWHEGVGPGKIYSVNLAIPARVFKDVGINYSSPYGAKTYVGLDPI